MAPKKILILGTASWLGSLMINSLQKKALDISGTYYQTKLNFKGEVKQYKANQVENYQNSITNEQPHVIINFLRGENEEGYQIHKSIIDFVKNNPSMHYVYASSALALDAYTNEELTEDKLAYAKSDYGVFKANCERALYDSPIDWTILRFASLQGYCSHKKVRNEHLLAKLSEGETVFVDQEIIQNRMYAKDAIKIIEKIVENKNTGIIHLGTTDASDEMDFLRKQAVMFGYDAKQIQPKNVLRNVNLNCIPSKIHSLHEASKYYTERDTLNKIANIKAYQKYKR